MPDHPVRRSVRPRGHDHASPGAYFVTVSTCDRLRHLGSVEVDQVVLSPEGEVVRAV